MVKGNEQSLFVSPRTYSIFIFNKGLILGVNFREDYETILSNKGCL